MSLFRVVYWGIAYTAGIICLTVFFLHYMNHRAKRDLQMIKFLGSLGLSVVCLTLMEGVRYEGPVSSFAGDGALLGAALTVSSFPKIGALMQYVRLRMRIAEWFRYAGYLLAVLLIVSLFLPIEFGSVFQILILAALAFAILTGLTWIIRQPRPKKTLSHRWWSVILFLLFPGVVILDLFRGSSENLAFLGNDYLVFPAYYLILNVFLILFNLRAKSFSGAHGSSSKETAETENAAKTALLRERFSISDREAEVLVLLLSGQTYREIADSLFISLATVKTHVTHIYQKSGARNKVELINRLYDSEPRA